jgi:hypothetical protein
MLTSDEKYHAVDLEGAMYVPEYGGDVHVTFAEDDDGEGVPAGVIIITLAPEDGDQDPATIHVHVSQVDKLANFFAEVSTKFRNARFDI